MAILNGLRSGRGRETAIIEQYLRQNEKFLNCHCEGGLGRVNPDVNRYDPPWQSHNLTVGLRKLAADLTIFPRG